MHGVTREVTGGDGGAAALPRRGRLLAPGPVPPFVAAPTLAPRPLPLALVLTVSTLAGVSVQVLPNSCAVGSVEPHRDLRVAAPTAPLSCDLDSVNWSCGFVIGTASAGEPIKKTLQSHMLSARTEQRHSRLTGHL